MISCLCPTYGRTSLLEESLESFLRQDYLGEKELIICNDHPAQKLIFTHPLVRVVNLRERCDSLGEKRNLISTLAKGDRFITWADDDIWLPHRITRLVKSLGDEKMMLEGDHFCWSGGNMVYNSFSAAGPHIIQRDFFWEVGGFNRLEIGEDIDFNHRAKDKLGEAVKSAQGSPALIYRWTFARPHMSGFRDINKSPWEEFKKKIDALIESGQEPAGDIELRPHWKNDWEGLAVL
jgi:glycosyltransferase involved in cell wall biosynthesis